MATGITWNSAERVGSSMVEGATPLASESIASAASSTQGTNAAPDPSAGTVVCTIASTVDVWVAFGANPTASAGTDHLVTSGSVRSFAGFALGDKVAILDA